MKRSTADFIQRIVISRGKEYTPALLPEGIKRGRPGDCFDWSMIQTLKNKQYRYVEGLAYNPHRPGEWVYHAWLTDGVHAFDPTWMATDVFAIEKPVPTVYIGIEFDIMEVAKFVKETEYKAVLANHWRAPELFAAMRKGELLI